MTIKSRFALSGKSRDSYLELVQDFPLASIRSEQHLREAVQVGFDLLVFGSLEGLQIRHVL
jgi:hypothetical protein